MSERLKFAVPRELFPFEHRFELLRSGERIHYVDEGTGQLLLMFHGNPTWSFIYRKLIACLRSSFRCIAMDYPGFGLSEAPPGFPFTPRAHSETIERFVDALGLRDLTLVVQDWGGPIGLGLGTRRPELVKRLVIGNTFAWPLSGDPRVSRFSGLMGGPVGRGIAYLFNGVVRFFIKEGIHAPTTALEKQMFMAPFAARESRWPTAFFPKQLVDAHEYLVEVERGLARLRDRPALLVWGSRDFAFREPYRLRFEETFPNHRTLVLENASHFWQYDAPEAVAEAIHSWMRS